MGGTNSVTILCIVFILDVGYIGHSIPNPLVYMHWYFLTCFLMHLYEAVAS